MRAIRSVSSWAQLQLNETATRQGRGGGAESAERQKLLSPQSVVVDREKSPNRPVRLAMLYSDCSSPRQATRNGSV